MRTPAHGVLEGVSRRTAIELCERFDIPVHLEPVAAGALAEADEVFPISTGGDILPIAHIDGRPLPAFRGPIMARLQGYWDLHSEPAYRDVIDCAETA